MIALRKSKVQTCTWRILASCTAAHCILHILRRPDRTSEGLRQFATVLPRGNPNRQAGCCWQGTYGSFGGEHLKLHPQPWAGRRVRGMFHAKEQSENMMVNTLPSKTKDKLCYYYSRRFLPVASGLAEARSASFSSSSLWFYCFANR